MKRLFWFSALGLALLAGGVWYQQATRAPAITYTTAPAERGSIQSKVTATGTISALVTVQVGSQVSGRISELLVDYNSPVKKGARLDPQLFEASLAQAQANFVAAESSLTRARIEAEQAARQLDRARQLVDRQLIARAEFETAQAAAATARAQVASAQAGVAQARAQVNQARLNLTYTTIVSPIDGTVVSRAVDAGQTVAASLQTPTLFEIAQDLRKAQVDASVSEADVGKLQPGMPAEFTVSAYPTDRFKGTVRQVRNAPQLAQNVVTYAAVIDVDNPELKLKPGMTANVTFVYADRPDALKVPNAALRFTPPESVLEARRKPSGDREATGAESLEFKQTRRARHNDPSRRRLWVLEDGQPEPVRVRIGITDGSYTEVVSGDLAEGAEVITDAAGGGEAAEPRQNRGGGRRMRMF